MSPFRFRFSALLASSVFFLCTASPSFSQFATGIEPNGISSTPDCRTIASQTFEKEYILLKLSAACVLHQQENDEFRVLVTGELIGSHRGLGARFVLDGREDTLGNSLYLIDGNLDQYEFKGARGLPIYSPNGYGSSGSIDDISLRIKDGESFRLLLSFDALASNPVPPFTVQIPLIYKRGAASGGGNAYSSVYVFSGVGSRQ